MEQAERVLGTDQNLSQEKLDAFIEILYARAAYGANNLFKFLSETILFTGSGNFSHRQLFQKQIATQLLAKNYDSWNYPPK